MAIAETRWRRLMPLVSANPAAAPRRLLPMSPAHLPLFAWLVFLLGSVRVRAVKAGKR